MTTLLLNWWVFFSARDGKCSKFECGMGSTAVRYKPSDQWKNPLVPHTIRQNSFSIYLEGYELRPVMSPSVTSSPRRCGGTSYHVSRLCDVGQLTIFVRYHKQTRVFGN